MTTLTLPRAETVAHELVSDMPNLSHAQALALVQAVYACVERCTIQSVVVSADATPKTTP